MLVNDDPEIPIGDAKDLHDDDFVPLSNAHNSASPINVRPKRGRRSPQRYTTFMRLSFAYGFFGVVFI
jgi:hypothetical protein